MVVGNKKFGVVSHLIVGGSGGILPQKIFVFFYPYIWLQFIDLLPLDNLCGTNMK